MANEEIYLEIEKWIATLPAWQQDASRRLLQNGSLNAQDIEQLVGICMQEGASRECQYEGISDGALLTRNADASFKLHSISEVQGVNAIKQKDPLSFDSGKITVVYGKNGSGKSGYSRILRKISGERDVLILPNIYADEKTSPKCAITITVDEGSRVLECDLAQDNFDDRLKLIDVFDEESGARYIASEREPLYLPEIFPFLLSLVEACASVKAILDEKKGLRSQSFLPEWPEFLLRTEFRHKVESLSWETSSEEFDVEWSNGDEAKLAELVHFVNNDSPEAKMRLLDIHVGALERLTESIEKVTPLFTQLRINALNEDINRKTVLTKSQNAFYVLAEDGGEISISSQEWRTLWNAASSFVLSNPAFDKPLSEFGESDKCPFCLMKLGEEGSSHIEAMDSFVESSVIKEIAEIRKRVDSHLADYANCRALESQLEEMKTLGLDLGNELPAVRDCIEKCITEGEFASKKDEQHRYESVSFDSILAHIESAKKKRVDERNNLENALDVEVMSQAQKQLDDLKSRQFLHSNKELISKEIKRLKQIHTLDQAIKLTRTNSISSRINKLSEALIAEQYIEKFKKEIEEITNGAIKVELRKRNPRKGRVPYAVEFVSRSASDVSPKEVLSEGEKRAVALAAFLADTMRCDSRAPLVFDDPINSLDEDYESRILSRLVQVSEERQVIVFTHRISAVVGICEAAKSVESACSVTQINSWPGGIYKGLASDCNISKNPKTLLNSLQEKMAALKECESTGSIEECEEISSSICTKIRIAVEACIEHTLCSQVVMRFRRAIVTKDKLKKLAKITSEDCNLLDSMMTKYSYNEHLAPSDASMPYRSYDELVGDQQKLLEWIDEFSKRE